MDHLESFIAECDRRTELAKKRLAETQEEISAEVSAKVCGEGGLHLQSSVSKRGWDLSVPSAHFGVDSGCPLPWLLEGRRDAVTKLTACHCAMHMS